MRAAEKDRQRGEHRERRKKSLVRRFSSDKYKLGIITDLIVYKPETNCYSKEDAITDAIITDAFETIDA